MLKTALFTFFVLGAAAILTVSIGPFYASVTLAAIFGTLYFWDKIGRGYRDWHVRRNYPYRDNGYH